jgi:hypothetical protein
MSGQDLDLLALRSAIEAERRGAWIGAVIFELFAIATVLPFSAKFRVAINLAPLGGGAWVLGTMGAGLALAGAFFARKALLQRDPNRTPMMLKLVHDPEDVVWVHGGVSVAYQVYGATTHRSRFLSVLCASRENCSMELPAQKVEVILRALEHHLPHARVGDFSQALLAQYRADPESVRLVPREEEARDASTYREPAPEAKPRKKNLPLPARAPYVLVALVALALVPIGPLAYDLVAPSSTAPE